MQQRLLLIPLLSLNLRRENDNSYRVFDFFLAPSQELLYCHPDDDDVDDDDDDDDYSDDDDGECSH